MANIKSSKKAIKVIAKKTDNNHEAKAKVKNLIKDISVSPLSNLESCDLENPLSI